MSMALKLFVLRHGKGGAFVKSDNGEALYFREKREAKAARDSYGGDVVVSYGPDHHKFKGV